MRALYLIAGDLWVYMSLWFVVSIIKKRADVADIAWGLGFILVAWIAYFFRLPQQPSLIINVLVTIWGLRLAYHIYRRNIDKTEDSRYAAWRKEWGAWFPLRSYFQVFIVQGLLLYLIATPVLFANFQSLTFNPFYYLGFIVWLIGFIFESLADYELARFKTNPKNKGKIMQSGVWSLTRHPNYFGEVTLWWGIYLMTLPSGWWTVVGPLTITYLILGVSGVPMLERKYQGNKEYDNYKKRVNGFFPSLPRLRHMSY